MAITDTRKIVNAIGIELTAHQKLCVEKLDLIYARKRPGATFAVVIVILSLISAALGGYYVAENVQNVKQAILETKFESAEDSNKQLLLELIRKQEQTTAMQERLIKLFEGGSIHGKADR